MVKFTGFVVTWWDVVKRDTLVITLSGPGIGITEGRFSISEFRHRYIPLNSGVLTWWYLTTLGLVSIIDDFVNF